MRISKCIIFLSMPLMFWQCIKKDYVKDGLFELLDETQSGIKFQNTVIPDDEINLLSYEYMYNGGGVGAGDFNDDGLPDLVFTGNMVPSKIYINQSNLYFEDITQKSGFNTEGKWCMGITVVDINSDGLDDIYVCVGGPGDVSNHPNLLYINQGDLTFKESAVDYGLADPNESIHAVFFDYDLDGDLDMYLLNGGGFEKSAVMVRPIIKDGRSRNTDKLYRNEGNGEVGHPVYKDVSKEAGISVEGFGLGVAVIDANKDDWPDLYVSNDYISRDLLYVNNQDGTFTERALEYFKHMSHFSMGNDVGDINNDGYQDILTLDMLPEDHYRRKMMSGPIQYDRFKQAVDYGYGHQYMRNMLHIDNGIGGYSEIGQLAGISQTDWSWSPLIADFDNDGFQDIYITNGFGKDITDLDFVNFRKDAVGPFADPEEVAKKMVENLKNRPAIILTNYAFKNNGDYTFNNVVKKWGLDHSSISNGAIYEDLDRDGDLEIIVNNINQPAFIYKNTKREKDTMEHHFLNVFVEGPDHNKDGIGTRIELLAGNKITSKIIQRSRGFQSSISSSLHFGLGDVEMIDSLKVTWPDGRFKIITNVQVDQFLSIDRQGADIYKKQKIIDTHQLFERVTDISYTHRETSHSDFKQQPMVIQGLTHQGPGMAVGDVDGNGLDDLFVGGAYTEDGLFFLQQNDGSFIKQQLPTKDFEDLGVVMFDLDNDKDLDLYIASGGTERYVNHSNYQDRIYINDGNGNFNLDPSRLPVMLSSTTSVSAGDYDQDGDLDLFVGGRVIPGQFPLVPESYILENDAGKFTDVTEKVNAKIKKVGMVTAALWTDFNNDGSQDLIIVGEFMNIRFFKNDGGILSEMTESLGLAQTSGLWNSLTSGDFDQDGDTDYLVGNIGLNNWYKTSEKYPLQLHYADFDKNGSIEPIFSVYEEGSYYPLASLDVITQQLPALKKAYLQYSNYAKAKTIDIINNLEEKQYETHTCTIQESILLENKEGKTFDVRPLPGIAQFAPAKGILVEDYNFDGLLDLVMVGNNYETEVVTGQYDASYGQVLLNNGDLTFTPVTGIASGLHVTGDARSMVKLVKKDDHLLIVVAQNNGQIQNFLLKGNDLINSVYFKEEEVSAILEFEDGRIRKEEYHIGNGYLSQNSKVLALSPNIKSIKFFNARGLETRHINIYETKNKS